MHVNILGTSYEIKRVDKVDDESLENCDGYCDSSVKKIVVENFKHEKNSLEDLESYAKQVIRHELIHAFLNESGLQTCSNWAKNEEMVDFFAIQIPKIIKAMRIAEAL